MKARSLLQDQRGSVLIVALLFTAAIAIGLTSHLKTTTTALRLSQRSLLANEAVNLAESGIEQALWSFNQTTSGLALVTAWNGWLTTGNDARRTFTGFSYPGGSSGVVKVYVRHYNSLGTPAPQVVAESIITPVHAEPIRKIIEVSLRRRSLFGTGLVGRNGLIFNGDQVTVNSWVSDPDNDPATAPVPYGAGVARDRATVAALNVNATMNVNNAEIWGYASVGGSSTSAISLGMNGRVGPFGTAPGVKDPTRIAANFTENLPAVTPPAPTIVNTIVAVAGELTLPGALDLPDLDGKYYYNIGSIIATDGYLNIAPDKNVVINVTTGSGGTGVQLTGNAGIRVGAGAALAVYTASNVSIAGNGLVNPNLQPITCQFWSTNNTPGSQTISVVGNGSLNAVVYAPNANVVLTGNGDIFGAATGYTAKLVGNAAFHYDEALANWGPNTAFKAVKWREIISASDRAVYASQLAF